MTAPTTQGVKVEQCDRDAAAASLRAGIHESCLGGKVEEELVDPIRRGERDASLSVQAFARHRHTQTAALLSILEELCEKHDTFLGEPRDDNPPESAWARARGLIAFYRGGGSTRTNQVAELVEGLERLLQFVDGKVAEIATDARGRKATDAECAAAGMATLFANRINALIASHRGEAK